MLTELKDKELKLLNTLNPNKNDEYDPRGIYK